MTEYELVLVVWGGVQWQQGAGARDWESAKRGGLRRAQLLRRSAHHYIASVWITASCPANINHSNWQLPRDSSVAVPQMQRLTPKERGSEKRPCKSHSSCHKVWVVMVVSDGLRSTLIIMVQISTFSRGSKPPDPLQCFVLCTCHTSPNSIQWQIQGG